MRILFISNFYPPHAQGGMEHRCQETVECMRMRGHHCHVLTSHYGTDPSLPSEEVVTRGLYLQADPDFYRPVDFFLHRAWQERANDRILRTLIDRFQPDVIFIWGMWLLSRHVPYVAEQQLPGRVAYQVAGYWTMEASPHEVYWREPSHRLITRILLAPARWLALRSLARSQGTPSLMLEHVACVSEYVRNSLSTAGVLPHGARIIYNGIDPEPFLQAGQALPSRKGLRLVCVGNLLPQKGPHTAIEALSLLQTQGGVDDIHLTLVGGGHPDYEHQLRTRVDALGLSSKVTFLGRVPRHKVAGILAEQDVFLFTSIYDEPIARTVMEAMAVGLPVIGTLVGGQREMLDDGVNALTFEPDDAEGLAMQISRLSDSVELRQRIAAAGRQMVLQHFTLGRMVDEMESWLKEIVGENTPGYRAA